MLQRMITVYMKQWNEFLRAHSSSSVDYFYCFYLGEILVLYTKIKHWSCTETKQSCVSPNCFFHIICPECKDHELP